MLLHPGMLVTVTPGDMEGGQLLALAVFDALDGYEQQMLSLDGGHRVVLAGQARQEVHVVFIGLDDVGNGNLGHGIQHLGISA